MPEFSSRIRIEFDPMKWPPDKLRHMRDEQDLPPWAWPEILVALGELKNKTKLKAAHNYEAWWIPLEKFNPKLRKFKLAGHGAQPDTIIKPSESLIEGRKLAFFELPEPHAVDADSFEDVDSSPNSLDLQ